MEYFVNNGMWGSVFAVPNSIVDDYIKLASGYAIKVLLYVLRNNNQVVEKQTLSSELNMPIEYVVKMIGSLNLRSQSINSWKNGVVRTLKKFIKDGKTNKKCEDCGGSNIILEEGCERCLDCGSSKCG